MSETIKVKKFDTGFTQIPNEVLNNPNLSLRAKGMYCYLLSKPDGWEFHTPVMEKELGMSFRQIRAILQEITKVGLIVRHQINTDGVFGGVIYEFINPTDIHKIPTTEKCVDGKNVSLNNTDLDNNNNNIYNNINSVSSKKTVDGQLAEQIKKFVKLLWLEIKDRTGRDMNTAGWSEQVRLMFTRDKVDPDDAYNVMMWHFSHLDRPYCHVIFSARAFREKYTSLYAMMQKNEREGV